MKLVIALVSLFLSAPVVSSTFSQAKRTPRSKTQTVKIDDIVSVIKNGFGSNMQVVTDTKPFYLLGDFNGDGKSDIAVLVNPEVAKPQLKQHGIKYIDVDPSSSTNGHLSDPESATFQYCFGVAIVHGSEQGWTLPQQDGKYLFYECFIPFRLVRRGSKVHRFRGERSAPPVLKGDAIYLYLERDAGSLVYWTGKTYRGYYQ